MQTVFIDPNEITKHFDGVLVKKDYHATHYILSKHLYPKQFKVASDNQFSVMFNFQKELQSKMGSKGQKEIFSVIGVDSKPLSKRQQKDRNNRRK